MADTVSVTIDRDECIACGSCWDLCPDFYQEGDDGLAQVMSDYRVDDNPARGKAPAELEDCVQEGADACPVEIIQVEAE